jgi:hypothetical protein
MRSSYLTLSAFICVYRRLLISFLAVQTNCMSESSQIETREPQQRVVLLGASNLTIMFPTIVETLRATYAHPIELHVAKGFGRSYGLHSQFFGKKFPGILSSGLWPALNRARPLPTVAIIADVGNDLAYEAPVDKIIEWVERALDRLAVHDARVVLNNVPIESLRMVGAARYYPLREALFPNCKLSRGEMLRRAEALSERLARLAEERRIPRVFRAKSVVSARPDPSQARLGGRDLAAHVGGRLSARASRFNWCVRARRRRCVTVVCRRSSGRISASRGARNSPRSATATDRSLRSIEARGGALARSINARESRAERSP